VVEYIRTDAQARVSSAQMMLFSGVFCGHMGTMRPVLAPMVLTDNTASCLGEERPLRHGGGGEVAGTAAPRGRKRVYFMGTAFKIVPPFWTSPTPRSAPMPVPTVRTRQE
jgi:hypothetical protein